MCYLKIMPATGIEPVREVKSRRILSPVRLPVPPRRQGNNFIATTYDYIILLIKLQLTKKFFQKVKRTASRLLSFFGEGIFVTYGV